MIIYFKVLRTKKEASKKTCYKEYSFLKLMVLVNSAK